MNVQTTRVELLTAEVRTLMVGDRQVTMSIYHQLDWVDPREIEPFGRVHSKAHKFPAVEVVGSRDGILVRSYLRKDNWARGAQPSFKMPEGPTRDLRAQWETLPLIVLAGLR
jgi:hypothetical protein